MNVWVEDLSLELHLRGIHRVVLVYCKVKCEPPLLVRSVWRSLYVAFPVEEIVIDGLKQDVLLLGPGQLH